MARTPRTRKDADSVVGAVPPVAKSGRSASPVGGAAAAAAAAADPGGTAGAAAAAAAAAADDAAANAAAADPADVLPEDLSDDEMVKILTEIARGTSNAAARIAAIKQLRELRAGITPGGGGGAGSGAGSGAGGGGFGGDDGFAALDQRDEVAVKRNYRAKAG